MKKLEISAETLKRREPWNLQCFWLE